MIKLVLILFLKTKAFEKQPVLTKKQYLLWRVMLFHEKIRECQQIRQILLTRRKKEEVTIANKK